MNDESFESYCDPLIAELKRAPARERVRLITDATQQVLALYDAGQIYAGHIGDFLSRVDDVVNINMSSWKRPAEPYPQLSAAGWDIREGDSDEADEAGVGDIRRILHNSSSEVQ